MLVRIMRRTALFLTYAWPKPAHCKSTLMIQRPLCCQVDKERCCCERFVSGFVFTCGRDLGSPSPKFSQVGQLAQEACDQ
jgi:hypothetical protein